MADLHQPRYQPTFGDNQLNVSASGPTGENVAALSPTRSRSPVSADTDNDNYDPTSVSQLNEDDLQLAKMGYKSILYRGFSGLMNFSFCFTAVATISSLTSTYVYGLATGGPAIFAWGWVVGSCFTMIIGLVMAEICSVYPNAGSVYYWAGVLAPDRWSPLASFITGWFNLLGNAAGDAAYAFAFGSILFQMLNIAYPNDSLFGLDSEVSNALNFQVGIGIAVAFSWALINAMRVDHQGWVNNTGALFQVSVTVVVIAVLFAYSSELQTPHFVFFTVNNETGFNTSPDAATGDLSGGSILYLCCIGLLSTLFSFSGYEAGGHMAEETRGAARSAPLGIVMTCVASALVGFAYLMVLLFNTFPDEDGLLGGNDPVTIFINVLGTNGGLALASIILVNLYFSGIASMTVTTRVLFAMGRDGAVPYGKWVAHVNRYTISPLRTVMIVFIVDAVLCCIALGATTAFAAITGLTTIGYQISYAIPITLRLRNKTFQQGVFHLGPFSTVLGWIAVAWLVMTSLFFFWPSSFPVDEVSMNYTCVVVGGVFILAMSYWLISARKHFLGPKFRAREVQQKLFAGQIPHDGEVAMIPTDKGSDGYYEKGSPLQGENPEKVDPYTSVPLEKY